MTNRICPFQNSNVAIEQKKCVHSWISKVFRYVFIGHPQLQGALCGFIPSQKCANKKPRKLLAHRVVSKMALASVLNQNCAAFSFGSRQTTAFDCGPGLSGVGLESTSGDNFRFAIRNPMRPVVEDGDVESKIQFLHGTTTLAFKVSHRLRWLARNSS